MKKTELLEQIDRAVRSCHQCRLYRTRTSTVSGEGSSSAQIAFVGEAPGFNEDREGRPFVGKAGKLLDELLRSINLSREEVWIGNVIKCRPP
ncbi:uracil-DNA glycosylase, partial [Candidatus Parcubacteria bacterium]|nr:uracil-DNA glycosylase [Candidatus Parcubacteria bacterium]